MALHIKRVTFPGVEAGQRSIVAPTTSTAKRPQPKGLKARYLPIGASDLPMGNIGSDASSDEEDVEMTPAPALPSSTPGSKNKKRKHDAATPDVAKSVKNKKARVGGSTGTPKQTPIAPPVVPVNGLKKVTPVLPPAVPGMKSN